MSWIAPFNEGLVELLRIELIAASKVSPCSCRIVGKSVSVNCTMRSRPRGIRLEARLLMVA